METDSSSDPRPAATDGDAHLVVGYTQEAVDDFLLAVARERESLQEIIKEARVREARAQGIIGMHELMVAMMLETHRELGARRRDAEARASEIVRQGEREAEEILRAAYDQMGAGHEVQDALRRLPQPSDPVSVPELDGARWGASDDRRGAGVDDPEIDLRGDSEGFAREAFEPAWVGATKTMTHNGSGANNGNNEDFFAFLRGALHDDEPLGPRADREEESWRP
jgi:hypothetical protein